MKKQFVSMLTKLSFLGVIALVAGSAQGQSPSNRLRANIPFDFAVGGQTMPAGTYSVGSAQNRQDDLVILVSGVDGRSSSMHLTNPVQTSAPKDKPTLVFHRYGDQYFLFQVWPAGVSTGRQLFKSRSERQIESKLAANPSAGKMANNKRAAETVSVVGVLQ